MSIFGWLWLGWGLAFLAIEGTALWAKDRPHRPATLTAITRWLITGAGPWHTTARTALVVLMVWLPGHLGVTP